MAKTRKNFGLILAVLLLILACAFPPTPPPPPPSSGFVETAIAGTHSFIASQTMQVQAVNASVTPTGTRLASATPFPTFTVVVFGTPQVQALVDAACRVGPGNIYDLVFTLRKGRYADLIGKSGNGVYWIIRSSDQSSRLCWVESSKVQVLGFSMNIPVMTPLPPPTFTPSNTPLPTLTPTNTFTPTITPTPTPAAKFDIGINGQDSCPATSTWWINFDVANNGAVDFESVSLTLTDLTTGTDFLFNSEEFTNHSGCGPPDSIDVLPVGIGHVVSTTQLNYDPTGNLFRAVVTFCTEPALAGSCFTNTLNNFSP